MEKRKEKVGSENGELKRKRRKKTESKEKNRNGEKRQEGRPERTIGGRMRK